MVTGFPPIIKPDSRVIILGSMPGVKSLQEYQYYAHPRNAFWPIMDKLFKIYSDFEYKDRLKLLLNNDIALWDVLQSCERQGSLDSSIKKESIIVNDFEDLLVEHEQIKTIFCNGNAAYSTFMKHAMPKLHDFLDIEVIALPSTSPANAKMSFEEKLEAWSIVKTKLLETAP